MLVSQSRPRVLGWYHAGPLLFGDWGTSRLYVLGLAFAATGFSSPVYLIALSLLMTAVAWSYTVVCRCFPEGGGVYTAARKIHPLLAVGGATLLLADYIITAALSLLDAFHYFGLPEGPGGWYIFAACGATIAILAAVNWLGAESAGRLALIVAVAAMAFSALIGLAVMPFVPVGLTHMSWDSATPPWNRWVAFTGIVLALSGVEAVANMTGLMKEPVTKTANRTIWPVLCEVAILNIVFGLGLCGMKAMAAAQKLASFHFSDDEIKNAAMKVLATEVGQYWMGENLGWWLGKIAAVVFGLLLVSAANTALLAMVSVLFALAQDNELPKPLTKLNYSGVPRLPLILAAIAPLMVLAFVRDLEQLSHLYAIGVCGAITINIGSCVVNKSLPIAKWERLGLGAIGVVIGAVWITIAITKLPALAFVTMLVVVVMFARSGVKWHAARMAAISVPEPELGWLAEVRREPLQLDPSKPRIMLAARGRYQAEFAVDMARRRGATLFAIYVRTLRVIDLRPGSSPKIEDDKDAQESLGGVAVLARQYHVPFVPVYVCSTAIAEEILDYTVTYGCDTLIMGKSQRKMFARRLEGDVVTAVAQHLPDGVALITREATPHPMGPTPQ